jgi:hypothetical protein
MHRKNSPFTIHNAVPALKHAAVLIPKSEIKYQLSDDTNA